LRTENADRRHISLPRSLREFWKLAQHADDIVAVNEPLALSALP
jgi:hypothetical protein